MNWNRVIFVFFCLVSFTVLRGQQKGFVNSKLLRLPKETSFGKMQLGQTKRVVIKVKNISKRPIALEHFTNNCTCVNVVYLNQKGIKPKQTDSIVILYKPSRPGYIEENLLLYINGVSQPLFCKLKGRVIQKIFTK